MRIEVQRRIDRILGTWICRLLSLFPWKDGAGPGGPGPARILVILLSEMGSLVLAHPMFTCLKERFPGLSLHVLVFERNRQCLELMGVVPEENILAISDASLGRFCRTCLQALVEVRRRRFDAVIDCELFARLSSILSVLSGAPVRSGFHPYTQEGLYRGGFINRPVLYNPYHHMAEQFLTLAEALDSETVPRGKRVVGTRRLEAPSFVPGDAEIEAMRQRLRADFPGIRGRPLVLLYPGAGISPLRAWPLESYCRLARGLLEAGCAVGVIGLGQDKGLAGRILSQCRSEACADLTGYTRSVRELAVLFHLGGLLVANDGGPVHIASMTPIPAIALYGPESPVLYRSLGLNTTHLFLGLSCSPCQTAFNQRKSPCDGDNVCLKKIRPEAVLAKALEVLGLEQAGGADPVG